MPPADDWTHVKEALANALSLFLPPLSSPISGPVWLCACCFLWVLVWMFVSSVIRKYPRDHPRRLLNQSIDFEFTPDPIDRPTAVRDT